MALRQCDKCNEMVDEAKAFCPGCGNAFVQEEKRQEASEFEKLGGTMQVGQTMYNQMLEDMGLNISGAPQTAEKRTEVITPINTEPAPHTKAAETITVSPATGSVAKPKQESAKSNTKFYILMGAGVAVLLLIALAFVVFVFLNILSRLK